MQTRVFCLVLAILAVSGLCMAAVPESFSYQGKLTTAGGAPVADGTHQVQFKLYTNATGGTAFWTSEVVNVQTTGGVFTTQIGPVTAASLTHKAEAYLEVLAGDPLAPLTPRVKLLSVPYALQAAGLQLTTGAATGTVLVSDAAGIGSWGKLTPDHFDTTGLMTGMALMYNGADPTWGYPKAGSLLLPFSASIEEQMPGIMVINAGDAEAFVGYNEGLGTAGRFWNLRSTNDNPALLGQTNGSGPAIKGVAGTGLAAEFVGKVKLDGLQIPGASSAGLVLTSDFDGNATWQNTGFSLPYFANRSSLNPQDVFRITSTGPATVGRFVMWNSTSPAPAFGAESCASAGGAGVFIVADEANLSDAVYIRTDGVGMGLSARSTTNSAGWFLNNSSLAPTVHATSQGAAPAIKGTAGTGLAAEFAGKTKTADLQVTNGAAAGKVLTSDASGNATWQNAASYTAGSGLALNGNQFSISTAGASSGQALTFNGASTAWSNPKASDLTLPFWWSVNYSAQAFWVINNGLGTAGSFLINNDNNMNQALSATSNAAGGGAASFQISNASNPYSAVYGHTSGTGKAANFTINNTSNSNPTVYAETNGSGPALKADGGTGLAGEFIGKTKTTELQVTNGAGAGKVLTSDASGNAAWQYIAPTSMSTTGAAIGKALTYTVSGMAWDYPTASALVLPYMRSQYSSSALIEMRNEGSGPALVGMASGSGVGVWGYTTGTTGSGGKFEILANNPNTALYSNTTGTGRSAHFRIDNAANSNAAAYAITNGTGSSIEAHTTGTGKAGYFRINNSSSNAQVLTAETNGTGDAGHFSITNGSNGATTLWADHAGTGTAVLGFCSGNANAIRGEIMGSGWAGYFWGRGASSNGVYISAPSGRVGLQVASGSKAAVVATSDGARLMYAEEAAEVWFTDYGFGKLQQGRVTVTIDPKFAETVTLTEPYHVFVQLNDPESEGVAVTNKSATGFDVIELRHGTSNAEFSYRIVARRKGYETERMKRSPSADNDPNLYPGK